MLDGELVFVPNEIPRRGVFALWGKGSGSAKLELVFPGGTYGIRKRLVSADLIPLAEALPVLLAIDPELRAGRPIRRSARVWAAAAAAGVGLVARGRLLPTVGPDDTDVWRAGPVDPADLAWLRELAVVFPPTKAITEWFKLLMGPTVGKSLPRATRPTPAAAAAAQTRALRRTGRPARNSGSIASNTGRASASGMSSAETRRLRMP